MLDFESWLTTPSGMIIIAATIFLIFYFSVSFIHTIAERNNVSQTTVVKVFLVIAIGIFISIILSPFLYIFELQKSARKEWRRGIDNYHSKKGNK